MKLKRLLTGALLALGMMITAQRAEATCSNYATYSSGQVLTASSLNSLQTNYTNCVNGVLDGDTFTGNMLWYSGTDIQMFSDTGSTLKAAIDAATGHSILAPSMEGFHTNCGFSNSGTTWTLAGYDATALSATNPCVIAIRSNTAGRTALAFFTANVTFTHGAASDTDGNLFGITDANWANTMPFFLGVVYDGTTPYFVISRLPYGVTGAAATAVCQKLDTDCDAQIDMMILTTGLTLSAWVNLPVTQVGWFNMTYATTNSAWTAAVTTADLNGFNYEYEKVRFTMPLGQNGAATGSFIATNGGTAPIFTTNQYIYQVNRAGGIWTEFFIDSDGGTDGAAANDVRLSLPYSTPDGTITQATRLIGLCLGATTLTGNPPCTSIFTENLSYIVLYYLDAAALPVVQTLAMYSNGNRRIDGSFTYNAMSN